MDKRLSADGSGDPCRGARLNAMTQTLAAMDESYGGLEEYLQGQMGLSDQDVLAIRKNLTAR